MNINRQPETLMDLQWIKLFCGYCKLVIKLAGQVSLVGRVVIIACQGLPCECELFLKKKNTFNPSFKVIMESGRK